MCGIAGIINLKQSESIESENIRLMTSELRHRGPDDEGYLLINSSGCHVFSGGDTCNVEETYVKPDNFPVRHIAEGEGCPSSVALGHRRLAILDLTMMGHQPMSYMGRYWIVHNGEIYNYLELRNDLLREGYTFVSQTDTEVIMASYDRWGIECLNKFNGMWAFALYDSKTKKVMLSRDRFGIKPLCYYFDQNRFLFASEIKSILKHAKVSVKPNMKYIQTFLRKFPTEYAGETAFEDIFHFPPACYMEIDLFGSGGENNFSVKRYWHLNPNLSEEEFSEVKAKELANQYFDLLDDCVKLRLRADVEVGSAFSGGLDSSSIVYLINHQLRKHGAKDKQKTFSTVFRSEETKHCDESIFINALVEDLDIESKQVEPTAKMVENEYEKMVYALEIPQQSSLMTAMFTYKLVAANDATVSIDGQGADELQAGYLPYLVNYFAHLQFSELKRQAKLFSRIPGAKSQIKLGLAFNILGRFSLNTYVERLLRIIGKYSSPFIKVNERLYNDLIGNLIKLFHIGDRCSMAYSIETRYPFMDYRMVEFWFRLPACYKLHEGWTKFIARKAFSGKLPDNIAWRKDKMGWENPEDYWFRGKLKDWVIDRIEGSKFLSEIGVDLNVRKELDKKRYDRKDLKKVLKLLNLAIWYDIFIAPYNVESD